VTICTLFAVLSQTSDASSHHYKPRSASYVLELTSYIFLQKCTSDFKKQRFVHHACITNILDEKNSPMMHHTCFTRVGRIAMYTCAFPRHVYPCALSHACARSLAVNQNHLCQQNFFTAIDHEVSSLVLRALFELHDFRTVLAIEPAYFRSQHGRHCSREERKTSASRQNFILITARSL
jgi:hypothetical protein